MKPIKLALAVAAIALAPVASAQSGGGNWNLTVDEDQVSHRIGNPNAKVKLTEYVSYTCSTCALFAQQGDPVLELAYVGSGQVQLEIRQFIRNPIDLAISLMTHCGAPEKFKQNHAAFMLSQNMWIAPLNRPTQAQVTRWTQPGAASRRNIANDFGFYRIMERRGYRITDVDKCLNDEAKAQAFAAATQADAERLQIEGTPTFAINGRKVDVSPVWSALQPELDKALANPNSSQNGL
ncbi:thioredoxin domain-containing protein [Erythrobacter sp. HA6-11]